MVILETERLYLREFSQEDIHALYTIFPDAETMKYYRAPFTYEQTQNWIKRNQERYREDGYGL